MPEVADIDCGRHVARRGVTRLFAPAIDIDIDIDAASITGSPGRRLLRSQTIYRKGDL
ncbi:hypothetical protein GCM10022224_017600 [Nonomuraea antimicrobica]|uniref:Uncharacterized protein n=1 Tax=Nonomuraea antimicrobica TaxID=561173 RepID=A0ABP7BC96_9ACTN